jgi:hypothetical protein
MIGSFVRSQRQRVCRALTTSRRLLETFAANLQMRKPDADFSGSTDGSSLSPSKALAQSRGKLIRLALRRVKILLNLLPVKL